MTCRPSEVRPAVILGGGGHARVIADAARLAGFNLVSYTNPSPVGIALTGLNYIGDDDKLLKWDPASTILFNGIGSIGDRNRRNRRKELFKRFRALGFPFPTLVHPTAFIAPGVVVQEGAQIMAGAVIQTGCRIGENTLINTGAIIDHDCHIGSHVHVAPGAVLAGEVGVGEGAHIGLGAHVLQGLSIGSEAIIGAGALVARSVNEKRTVMGVPARERPDP